jgi:predicted DNA-binding transcriptional regulator AlpA
MEHEHDVLMTEKQVSAWLNISLRTLQAWRVRRMGPRYIKLSRRMVRYSHAQVLSWLESQKTGGETPCPALSVATSEFNRERRGKATTTKSLSRNSTTIIADDQMLNEKLTGSSS